MRKYLILLSIALAFTSCEDVIDVKLDTEDPRLNVDAIIRIDTSKEITAVKIKINLTSSFFNDNQPTEIDEVKIKNIDYITSSVSEKNFIILSETEPGIYEAEQNTNFFTQGELHLYITYGKEEYLAKTNFAPSVPFDSLEQGDQTLFSGDETEVIVTFTDIPYTENYYILDFGFNEYVVTDDELYKDQTFVFSYFYDAELVLSKDATLPISIIGADIDFYNYMNQVTVQSGGDQGPFATPAATVKGNIANVTTVVTDTEKVNNFALGYFAVVQEFKDSVTIEKDEN